MSYCGKGVLNIEKSSRDKLKTRIIHKKKKIQTMPSETPSGTGRDDPKSIGQNISLSDELNITRAFALAGWGFVFAIVAIPAVYWFVLYGLAIIGSVTIVQQLSGGIAHNFSTLVNTLSVRVPSFIAPLPVAKPPTG
jgi:hypothetical protein